MLADSMIGADLAGFKTPHLSYPTVGVHSVHTVAHRFWELCYFVLAYCSSGARDVRSEEAGQHDKVGEQLG